MKNTFEINGYDALSGHKDSESFPRGDCPWLYDISPFGYEMKTHQMSENSDMHPYESLLYVDK